MNILYCGDFNILDGLIISILSLARNSKEDLNIYVFTMDYTNEKHDYKPLTDEVINKLEQEVRKIRDNISIKLLNITDVVNECLPIANINTKFTPFCMLRLYADQIDGLPSKLLYLDNDVVALKDPIEFYNLDVSNYDLAGVLDNYGSHIFKKKINSKDYLNSGVLLLNLDNIKKHKVFEKSRNMCRKVVMLMPDQSALNTFAKHKLIVDRKYNEQVEINDDTVFRHFTTTFKYVPTLHTQTIKPWNIEELHSVLKVYVLDDLLNEYLDIKKRIL